MSFSFQLSIEQAQAVAEQVEMKAKVVQSEVKAVTTRHKKALEERECELLWKVSTETLVLRTLEIVNVFFNSTGLDSNVFPRNTELKYPFLENSISIEAGCWILALVDFVLEVSLHHKLVFSRDYYILRQAQHHK